MGKMVDFYQKIKDGAVGFKMNETMTGHHWFEPGQGPQGTLFMEFSGTWGPENLRDWADRSSEGFLTQPLEGKVTIEGLCQDAPMQGTLQMRYFDDHKIRYTFDFEANGRKYHYVGEKVNIRPWNLPFSHTTCFGRLTDAKTGKLISTSVTLFKLKTSPKFIRSLRLTSTAA